MTTDSGERTIHRQLDKKRDSPGVQVVEIIADIEGRDVTDLKPMYHCTDGVIDHIFSDPPSPEAQMRVQFSYEGYRITIEQDGNATFVKTKEPR